MKILLIFTFAIIQGTLCAQVKIGGSGTPNTSAMLELESNNRGFLPPRINLTSLSMPLNGTTPTNGMIIYSTNATTGTGVGLYVWYNSRWNRMIEKLDAPTHARFSAVSAVPTNGIQWTPSFISQPSELQPMHFPSDPTQIWIRTGGLYLISTSVRMTAYPTLQITININGSPSGGAEFFNEFGTLSATYTGIHFLQAGDGIKIMTTDIPGTGPTSNLTHLSITQIPLTSY